MTIHTWFNLGEALLWIAIAVVIAARALRTGSTSRGIQVALVMAFFAFGISDLVEMRTGAWWRPWWLFAWKAVCVVVLAMVFYRFFRIRKSKDADESASSSAGPPAQ